jgi:hypothetical protein
LHHHPHRTITYAPSRMHHHPHHCDNNDDDADDDSCGEKGGNNIAFLSVSIRCVIVL